MNNKKLERIMDKIKRCLALSKSSNETESATALRQAHKMMEQYGISMTDIKLADIQQKHSQYRVARRPSVYLTTLSIMIAQIFGCEVYIDNVNNKGKYCFVGLEMHTKIASYAYDVLYRQLKQARLHYMKTQLKRVRLAKNKAARADAFCLGWVITVRHLIKNLVPLQTDKQLINQFMRQELRLVTVSALDRIKNSNAKSATDDYANGLNAGKEAKLHHAMHSTNSPKLIN
ncbi:DUF2786 domain-containing protein [Psychrobacter sp. I-STPA10]|uniref:DUF2786 domain-containing protein n=1 Tax=Psychrobacter sp. I-STPA10 TaxID=2585769 RepID=UPI001E2C4EA3|nr:DUF2786 domain-containing protein [Psychrobacter sp. I-STPA10]